MAYPPGSGPTVPSFPLHTDVGYSSQSDIETANATDYSDHEAGYSSAASSSFDFIPGGAGSGYASSARLPPAYAARYGVSNSQSPPNLPAQPHFYQQSQGQAHSPHTGGPPGSTSPAASGEASQGQATHNASGQSQQYQRIARFVGPPPVALACTECRSRHLKCDAGVPACSRCVADKRECCYVKSRRGWKGTRRKKVAAASAAAAAHAESQQSGTDTEGPEAGSSNGEWSLLCPTRPHPSPALHRAAISISAAGSWLLARVETWLALPVSSRAGWLPGLGRRPGACHASGNGADAEAACRVWRSAHAAAWLRSPAFVLERAHAYSASRPRGGADT